MVTNKKTKLIVNLKLLTVTAYPCTLQRFLSHSCTASPQTPTCPQFDSWFEEGSTPLTCTCTAQVCVCMGRCGVCAWCAWVVCVHGVCEWCVCAWCVCMACVCVCVSGVCVCDVYNVCVERKGSLVSNICYKHWSIKAWILPLRVYGETGTFIEK